MKNTKRMVIVFSILVIHVLSGCRTYYPNDLELLELSLINVQSETEKELDYGRYNDDENNIYRLKLDFVSAIDLLTLAKENHYTLNINSYFCNEPEVKVLIDMGEVYWQDLDITDTKINDDIPIKPDESGYFQYSLHLGLYSPEILSWKKNPDGSRVIEYNAFDLVNEPSDICVQIRGGAIIGGSKTNVIKIEKKLIMSKIEKLTK